MPNQSRDNPREAEIQRLIAEHNFPQALEKIRSTYWVEIKRHCVNGLRGYVNDHIADGEELAQDILTEFILNISDYKPHRAGVRTFLLVMTEKRILDRRRTAKSKLKSYYAVWREFQRRDYIYPNSRNPEKMVLDKEFKKNLTVHWTFFLRPIEQSSI